MQKKKTTCVQKIFKLQNKGKTKKNPIPLTKHWNKNSQKELQFFAVAVFPTQGKKTPKRI